MLKSLTVKLNFSFPVERGLISLPLQLKLLLRCFCHSCTTRSLALNSHSALQATRASTYCTTNCLKDVVNERLSRNFTLLSPVPILEWTEKLRIEGGPHADAAERKKLNGGTKRIVPAHSYYPPPVVQSSCLQQCEKGASMWRLPNL